MEDDDLIPISALQHYLYCPRQCALIHLEQQWAENRQTAEGRLLHLRADKPKAERRRGVRTVTAMPLLSLELGITGKADMVEFHVSEAGERAFPVEYKRGKPKAHRADEVQLCAQALCLEAMLGTPVVAGALFYGQTRRRQEVAFDTVLRELTRQAIDDIRRMLASGKTPTATYEPKLCDRCSLIDACRPRLLVRRSIEAWLRRQLEDEEG
ncbi:CRISPR-associated protein Cas4 [Rhodanobacter thiooxydans]|uniref:CRISPR-associated exonuclease Cas4 n=1 Tax=Rhodanobacter thiooxydans TaxID=416169 RepID=A0A154QHF1_9GAMM|nr:CRISPR-associated protein Cas4 [Rhodanobacter thiooxydans]EIL98036.1 CRISPR-associated protein Cas4 [Rhodanobacter thiooxydans LCS2]KZC23103.1 CRISPR-associated protein Cas4 [Rhodanobacter thiooxydans]MCW0201145.1 CRISPR-associated protein Cas4 [Rhodanobacter thiooxydans]